MKKILSIIIVLSLVNCLGKKDHLSQDLVWIDFEWSSIELNGKDYEKGSMMVPVSLNSNVTNSFMQLDLGSSISMLYDKPINKLVSDGVIEKFALDTVNIESSEKDGYSMTKELNLKFADKRVNPEGLLIKKDFGKFAILGKKIPNENKIGTLGVDYFSDKILILDYLNKKLSVTDSLPQPFIDKAIWQDCEFNGGSPLISLTVNEQKLDVIFDTGSSLFALLTKKSIYENVTSDVMTPDTLSVPSFGRMLTIVGKPISESAKFNEKELPNDNAYFFVQQEIEQKFNQAGIDGLTGNKLFLSSTIIIDFKNGRFGIQE